MPAPLNPNEIVYVERLTLNNYSMPVMQAATDHYNIGFILSGDRKWISNEYIRIGHAGNVGISKPNVYHRNCAMSDTPYERYILKIKTEAFSPVLEIVGENEINRLCAEYLEFSKDHQRVIMSLFEEMLTEYKKKTPASQLVLQGMVYKLFFFIYDNHIRKESGRLIYQPLFFDERIQEALVYVENNIKNTPSITEVANHVSVSPSHFSRLFKNATGTSFSDYVSEVRLEHACILLKIGMKSIHEIALEVGLSSGNYLCNLFKSKYNMTPSEYKRRNIL